MKVLWKLTFHAQQIIMIFILFDVFLFANVVPLPENFVGTYDANERGSNCQIKSIPDIRNSCQNYLG